MVSVMVFGNYACFTRPELKAERYSYDVMTPGAARNILQAIYWHPGFNYEIVSIQVCNPIRFAGNIKRNELESKISTKNIKSMMLGGEKNYLIASEKRQQRSTIPLKDVCYVINANVKLDNPADILFEKKILAIFNRRVEKGQCFSTPYLGCKEFEASFIPCESIPNCPDELIGCRDLGIMLYDMDFKNPTKPVPMFFRAVLKNGVMKVPSAESEDILR